MLLFFFTLFLEYTLLGRSAVRRSAVLPLQQPDRLLSVFPGLFLDLSYIYILFFSPAFGLLFRAAPLFLFLRF